MTRLRRAVRWLAVGMLCHAGFAGFAGFAAFAAIADERVARPGSGLPTA